MPRSAKAITILSSPVFGWWRERSRRRSMPSAPATSSVETRSYVKSPTVPRRTPTCRTTCKRSTTPGDSPRSPCSGGRLRDRQFFYLRRCGGDSDRCHIHDVCAKRCCAPHGKRGRCGEHRCRGRAVSSLPYLHIKGCADAAL